MTADVAPLRALGQRVCLVITITLKEKCVVRYNPFRHMMTFIKKQIKWKGRGAEVDALARNFSEEVAFEGGAVGLHVGDFFQQGGPS